MRISDWSSDVCSSDLEMNRSRRMAALQARALAALGIDVLLLDLFGTGDSAGDFRDARWEIWREDAMAAVAWLGARCGGRSEEHTSELQSLMRISYAVFCLKKKNKIPTRMDDTSVYT